MITELFDQRIVLVLGPGGVGKTTTATALAIEAAERGKRVALVSIDPAKRLAAAMGIGLGFDLKSVPIPGAKGSLHACMLDQAEVFDGMVRRYASEQLQEKIFANPTYRQVSRNLGGPIEYMALAKLAQLLENPQFDLIVLDTPPDAHALDFLVKPNILAGFVEKGVIKWLIKPFHYSRKLGMGKLLSFGEKLMGGLADVTGIKMLEMLAEFLILMESVIGGFHLSGQRVAQAVRGQDARFVIVATPFAHSCRAAVHLAEQLAEHRFSLDTVVVNRLRESLPLAAAKVSSDHPAWHRYFARCGLGLQDSEKRIGELEQRFLACGQKPRCLIKMFERCGFIHDIDALRAYGKALCES